MARTVVPATGRRLVGVAAFASVLLLTACGTRMTHDAIVSAGSTTSGPGAATSGPATGGVGGGSGEASGQQQAPATSPGAATGTGATGSGATAGTTGQVSTNGTGGGSGSGPSGGAGPRSVTLEPIVIGSVGDYSGVAGASEKDGPRGLQIWVQWVNAHGGINGHPVKVYVVDDGMDPQRYQAALKDLVENKHVIAFVDNFAPFTVQAGVKYLESRQVPVIGGDCAEYIWNQSPMLFPQCPSFVNGVWGIVRVAALHGVGKNFGALVCSEASACTAIGDEWFGKDDLVRKAGMNPVYHASISIGQPDFTAECLNARNAKVQVMSIVADVNTVARVVNSCDRQGFHPQYDEGSGTIDAHLATLPGMQNALVQLNAFHWDVKGNKGVDDFLAAVKQYAPDQALTPTLSQGWAGALVFAGAAAHVGAHPTSADILAGLWAMKDATFGGLTTPLTFVKGKPAPAGRCSFWMQVKDGKLTAPAGLDTFCRS